MPTPTLSGTNVIVNAGLTAGTQDSASAALLDDGRTVVVWRDGASTIRYKVLNADGSDPSISGVINSGQAGAGAVETPVVTGLANGGFAVAWDYRNPSDRDIWFRAYDATLAAVGAESLAHDANAESQSEPDIAALADGGFAITWTEASTAVSGVQSTSSAVLLRTFSAGGAPTAAAATISDSFGGDFASTIAVSGNFVNVVWDDNLGQLVATGENEGIFGLEFGETGAFGSYALSADTGGGDGRHQFPDIAYLASNLNFGGVWTHQPNPGGAFQVAGRFYTGSGLMTQTTVNTTALGALFLPGLTAIAGNAEHFLAVWHDGSSAAGGADHDILGQLFDAAGNRIGAEFVITSQALTFNFLTDASITRLLDDRFLVTFGGGAAAGDVLAQYVDSRSAAAVWTGAAVGEQFVGTRFNDTLNGGDGSDTIAGGGGRDVAVFDAPSTAAGRLRNADGSWTITTGGFSDILKDVEVAQFTDRNVALREAARADVNGDGTSDLIWFNAAAGLISFYEVNPAGGYAWRNIGGVGPGVSAHAGDFNGDGQADVMFFSGSAVSYYDVDPAAGYVWRGIGSVTAGHTPIVGDYNGDGTSDIAFIQNATGRLSYYEVNPAGGFTWKNIGSVALGYTPFAGDFNGDGKSDIMFFNGTSVSYYDIGAAGGYTWRNMGGVGAGHKALVGDFSGDGTTDIAFINQTTNQISFYEVNPAGGYSWRNIGFVAPGYTATAADVSGDGKTDIVFTGFGSVSYYDIGPTGGYTWHNIGGVGAGYLLVA